MPHSPAKRNSLLDRDAAQEWIDRRPFSRSPDPRHRLKRCKCDDKTDHGFFALRTMASDLLFDGMTGAPLPSREFVLHAIDKIARPQSSSPDDDLQRLADAAHLVFGALEEQERAWQISGDRFPAQQQHGTAAERFAKGRAKLQGWRDRMIADWASDRGLGVPA